MSERQVVKRNPVKSFIVQVVYLTVLLIPEILLKKLTKLRMKRALIKQWNAMPVEQQLFFWQLSQKIKETMKKEMMQ
jgi:hypothetical protein